MKRGNTRVAVPMDKITEEYRVSVRLLRNAGHHFAADTLEELADRMEEQEAARRAMVSSEQAHD